MDISRYKWEKERVGFRFHSVLALFFGIYTNFLCSNWFGKPYVMFLFPGYTESLDKDIEILVPDDDYGLYAIDILDPSFVRYLLAPWKIVKERYYFAFFTSAD